MQSGLIGLGGPIHVHAHMHFTNTHPLLCLYSFLSILKEAVVPHPLRLGQVAVPRLECGNPASGLSPGLADYLPDLLGSLCPSALNDKDHPTQIFRPFPQMLVGRANWLFHLHSLFARLAHHLDFTFIHLFIYFVSPALSEHNPHDALCLCSLRIFQPTDGIFSLFLFIFSLVKDTETALLSSGDSRGVAFACACAHLVDTRLCLCNCSHIFLCCFFHLQTPFGFVSRIFHI